jgi:hypothetical protein
MPAPISLNSAVCSMTCAGMPLARERQSGGQPANAAADDQDLLVFPGWHGVSLPTS